MVDVEKLLAAIAETERKAWAVPMALRTERWSDPGPWVMHGGGDDEEVAIARPAMPIAEKVAAHIAHHDPVAVLRRCAADQEIIGVCHAAERRYERGEGDVGESTLAMMVRVHLCEAYGVAESTFPSTSGGASGDR